MLAGVLRRQDHIGQIIFEFDVYEAAIGADIDRCRAGQLGKWGP